MNNNKARSSIVYVNFKPYGNSGNILTYILKKYHTVVFFEFNFHNLGKNQRQNNLTVYQNGRPVLNKRIFELYIPSHFVFILLPIRSLAIFLQLIHNIHELKRKYGVFDVFFSVNAFTSWCGNVLKKMGYVKKTIFWVWDYYPPIHKDKAVMLMRSFYWLFDKAATKSDRLVFLNNRLLRFRQNIGVVPNNKSFPIVGIGTHVGNVCNKSINLTLKFAFLGAIKKSQGLDFIFDYEKTILSYFPKAEFHIFGGGPDEQYFRNRAKHSHMKIIFHGFMPNSSLMEKELMKCSIGLALYKPEPDNVSYFGDPSKIKAYISVGLPVITTNVFEFSKEIINAKAGFVISYNDPRSFVLSIQEIQKNYTKFHTSAIRLAKCYEYTDIYQKLFMD